MPQKKRHRTFAPPALRAPDYPRAAPTLPPERLHSSPPPAVAPRASERLERLPGPSAAVPPLVVPGIGSSEAVLVIGALLEAAEKATREAERLDGVSKLQQSDRYLARAAQLETLAKAFADAFAARGPT